MKRIDGGQGCREAEDYRFFRFLHGNYFHCLLLFGLAIVLPLCCVCLSQESWWSSESSTPWRIWLPGISIVMLLVCLRSTQLFIRDERCSAPIVKIWKDCSWILVTNPSMIDAIYKAPLPEISIAFCAFHM